jgi:UDP-N-acetylglucosamine--N-acetylmuramyl-(pentapeptide) pyrophosphoryl-undecaprenol N-acetylglucosamine transferase
MIMAGGTGGHVFPALAVAKRLTELGAQVFWIGTPSGIEARLVPAQGIEIDWIPVRGLRGSGVGRLLAVPLVVHEQNRVPGLTNRWLARLATRLFEAFPGSFAADAGAQVSGNPVRAEIAALPAPEQRHLGQRGRLRLLVLGGSQGALALNRTLPKALALLPPERRPLVRHQAGAATLAVTQAGYAEAGVAGEPVAFIEDMAEAYGWADLVLARAGALTLSELAAAGVGSLLVPYPHAVDDHQTRNAAWLVEAGAARLLPQATLSAEGLAAQLEELDRDRDSLLALAQAARAQARIKAADLVLAIGARLGEATTDSYTLITPDHPDQQLIHVHPDPAELDRVYRTDLAICADMTRFAAAAAALPAPASPFASGAQAHGEWQAWNTPAPFDTL